MIDWLLIHALDRIKISTMKPFNQKSFKTAVLKTIEYQNGKIEEQTEQYQGLKQTPVSCTSDLGLLI